MSRSDAAIHARYKYLNLCDQELPGGAPGTILSASRATLHIEHHARGAALRAEKSARRFDNLQAIEHVCARLEVLSFSAIAATHYGQIRAELERAVRPAGSHDMMIGAHARSEGLVLVTNNIREFERITGLQVENWV